MILTGNIQGGLSAAVAAVGVGGDAPVDAGILLLLVLLGAQEEQRSIWKQHPM